jgi:hypothetical protein
VLLKKMLLPFLLSCVLDLRQNKIVNSPRDLESQNSDDTPDLDASASQHNTSQINFSSPKPEPIAQDQGDNIELAEQDQGTAEPADDGEHFFVCVCVCACVREMLV